MKYLMLYESYWGDRFYWKVPINYFEIALSKIKTPPLRLSNDQIDEVPLSEYSKLKQQLLTWGDDDDNILITYNHGEWGWSATWNDHRFEDDNYEYQGEIILEPYEKDAHKFNL